MAAKELARLFRKLEVAIFGTIRLGEDGVDFEAESSASARLFDDLWQDLVGILKRAYQQGIKQINIRQVGADVIISTDDGSKTVLRNW